MLERFRCQQSLFSKGADPCRLEILKGLHDCIPLGKYQERVTWCEIIVSLSDQLAKNPLGTIPPHGNAKSPADDNPHLAEGIRFPKEQQIEEMS